MTAEDRIVGTASHMVPEQATGADVDERSDLYSLRAMLYETVSGHPPFLADSPLAVLNQHIQAAPTTPSSHNPECHPQLEALILQLLAKDPAQRPQSAAAVLATLDAIRIASRTRKDVDSPELESRPLQVLMIEDSEDDALLVLRELARGGFDVIHQRVDTPTAMRAALEEGTWDVVISDHAMPRFNAPAALGLLRNSGLDLPFIIVSGTISDELAVSAMKSGASQSRRRARVA